jgi:thymidylate kinase
MYWQFIEARNKITEGNIILDRYILSNMVYSSVCDSQPVYDQAMFYEELLVKLSIDKACLIFCLPSNKEQYLKEFAKLSQEREELITSVSVISKIFDAYKCYYDKLKALYPNNVFQFDRLLNQSTHRHQ